MPTFDVELVDRETGAPLGVARVRNAETADDARAAAAVIRPNGARPLLAGAGLASLGAPEPRWTLDADAAGLQAAPGPASEGSFDPGDYAEEDEGVLDPRFGELVEATRGQAAALTRLAAVGVSAESAANSLDRLASATEALARETARARLTRSMNILSGVFFALVLFSVLAAAFWFVVIVLFGAALSA